MEQRDDPIGLDRYALEAMGYTTNLERGELVFHRGPRDPWKSFPSRWLLLPELLDFVSSHGYVIDMMAYNGGWEAAVTEIGGMEMWKEFQEQDLLSAVEQAVIWVARRKKK